MTEMPDEFEADAAVPAQRINGVIDVPRPNRVSGWAIDRSDPDASVTVTVLREGRVVGEMRADAHRPDLERGGIGTGRYGFGLDLDPPLEPGFEFTVTAVARADDGATGEVRPVGRARPSDDANRRLAERTFTELAQVRAALRHVAGRQDRGAEMRALEMLDRIEVVQARVEQALTGVPAADSPARGRGIVLAVALSLAIGTGSLALGIWSMIAG